MTVAMASSQQQAQVQQDALSGFRKHLPDLSHPRFTTLAQCDAHSHAEELLVHQRPPWLYGLYSHWMKLKAEPFKGVTNDGVVRPNLFKVRDEGIDMPAIVDAANQVIQTLEQIDAANPPSATTQGQQTQSWTELTCLHIDSPEWRTWSNPEFLLSNKGVRLDELPSSPPSTTPESLREAILRVLSTTLSAEGYQKALSAMRINGFLGQLVNGTKVMNEWSYNFVFFGRPSTTTAWGWALYGHHLCLSVFLYKSQIIVSPWFTGAEPNLIDEGEWKGTRILVEEERLGLELIRSLGEEDRDRAVTYKEMKDEKMPKGRWNHDDQRHLCGAYRDNRVVPYEGVSVAGFSAEQKRIVEGILEQYLLYLPEQSRRMKIADCRSWYDETFFSWIGGTGDEDPFYYRIQSPVVLVEFDHHSGVFLTNQEPAKFHIHTLLRTPNGGDYGMALRGVVEGDVEQEYLWEP